MGDYLALLPSEASRSLSTNLAGALILAYRGPRGRKYRADFAR